MFHYNFSTTNYDAINGSLFGSMRLGWNQGMMHSCVYPSLFCYPSMSFGAFTPYQNSFTNSWLLDPGYALMTTIANLQQCGFMGNGGMNIQTIYPQNPSQQIVTTQKTEEEKAQENKLKNLVTVAKEVVSKLSGETKTTLQTAIDKKDGTVEEKITALESALKTDSIKAELEKMLLNPPSSIKVGSKKLSDILKELGLNATVASSKITDMNTHCKSVSGISENKVTLLHISKNNVLEYIEGLENFDLINGKNTELYEDLKESLLTLAQEVEDNEDIDSTLKAKVAELRAKFIVEDSDATLEDFKSLYAITLLAVSNLADKKLEESQGDVLKNIINEKLYTKKAKETLNQKGITAEAIDNLLKTEE